MDSTGHPLKGIFARRYFGTDGSYGNGLVRLTEKDVDWLDGLIEGGKFEKSDMRLLVKIRETLKSGSTVDMWFEY
jgi:hypothetical protein